MFWNPVTRRRIKWRKKNFLLSLEYIHEFIDAIERAIIAAHKTLLKAENMKKPKYKLHKLKPRRAWWCFRYKSGNINRVIMWCSSELSPHETQPKTSLFVILKMKMINHSLKKRNRFLSIDNKISFVDGGLKKSLIMFKCGFVIGFSRNFFSFLFRESFRHGAP